MKKDFSLLEGGASNATNQIQIYPVTWEKGGFLTRERRHGKKLRRVFFIVLTIYSKYEFLTKIPHTRDTESLDRCGEYHLCHEEKKKKLYG